MIIRLEAVSSCAARMATETAPQSPTALPSIARPLAQTDPGFAVERIAFGRDPPGGERIHHALAGILEAAFVDHPP